MVKEPRPGRVKTRLGRDIGMVDAAWWYRHQTRALQRNLRDPRWKILLAVAPDREGLQSRVWSGDMSRIPQGSGDLGVRMARVFAATPGPTLLIGSDIPGITKAHISRAFGLLRRGGSVIAPSTDGGYWLVGLSHPARPNPRLFDNVRWSSPDTLADTLCGLPSPIAMADTLRDVDTVSDLSLSRSAKPRDLSGRSC